jgi:hypothetical protein
VSFWVLEVPYETQKEHHEERKVTRAGQGDLADHDREMKRRKVAVVGLLASFAPSRLDRPHSVPDHQYHGHQSCVD